MNLSSVGLVVPVYDSTGELAFRAPVDRRGVRTTSGSEFEVGGSNSHKTPKLFDRSHFSTGVDS